MSKGGVSLAPSATNATIVDVANAVGVSPRTVSRVVNDEGGFSESTRGRVLEAIADLDYRPNQSARALVGGPIDAFGFITPMMDDPFFPELAIGLQQVGAERNKTLFYSISNDDEQQQAEVLRQMLSHSVRGAIIFPASGSTDSVVDFADKGLRFVVVDDFVEHPNVVSVCSDFRQGAQLAVQHLHARSRSKIAFLAAPSPDRKQRRLKGYLEEIDRLGLEPIVVDVGFKAESAASAIAKLLSEREIDAIFAYNDMLAVGAVQALTAHGLRVPNNVAVVGCDGIELTKYVTPTLTTIDVDYRQLGTVAVESLISLCAGVKPNNITLPVRLVQRNSS